VTEGHEVRVICSRGRYLEGKGTAPRREDRNGVVIERVGATSFGKRSHVGRLIDYLSFHALATARVLFSRQADVVVTLTTPPLIGLCGRLARAIRGTKHVNFVMDLHPDAEFECKMIRRRGLAGRFFARLAGSILRRADMNVVLGRFQGARVLNWGVDREKITEIPVWSDGDEIAPVLHADNPLRERMGWSERFVVMYSGNAGLVHVFDEVLDAAERLAETDPEVLFVFVGGGPRKAEIEASVRAKGLANVQFLNYFDRSELRYSLTAADVHFMSLRPRHVGVAVPGKLYGILAAGRPVLFVGSPQSDSAGTIMEAGAGSIFGIGEGAELADEIRELKSNPDQCREQGERGREHFIEHHERAVCVAAWCTLLESMVGVERGDIVEETESVSEAWALDEVPGALPASASRTTREETSKSA